MRDVSRAAADDAGAAVGDLLADIGMVLVPEGIWAHTDPGRDLAEGFGATAHTVVGQVGVLQQTLLTRAAQAIARGRLDVALVVGGEDKHRQLRAAIEGLELDPAQEGRANREPDERWRPDGEILSRMEIERDLAVPAHQYALIEQALAHAEGRDGAANAERLGALWARFAAVAAERPEAWDRSGPSAAQIVEPSASNRLLATPYTKRLCSQWNVDQAAALMLVSALEADRRGIPRHRWVFPLAAAESNAMIHLSARAELQRSPATAEVGRALADATGRDVAEVDLVDLYSCFPAAVGVAARELGFDEHQPLTVTGGMTFAGGPFNNYVLGATATMVERLRSQPGSTGLVTAVSGLLTKSGGALWSTEPTAGSGPGFVARDVTGASILATEVRPVDPDASGPATIVAATVIHDRGEASRAVAVLETRTGVRTVAVASHADAVESLLSEPSRGRPVMVIAPGAFVPG